MKALHRSPWRSLACIGLLTQLVSSSALAAEYIEADRAAPDEAKEVLNPVDVALEAPEEDERRVLFPGLKERLQGTPAFVRDATLVYNFRTYDFRRENRDDSRNDAWGIGGEFALTTGQVFGIAKGGLSYYISQPLRAPDSRPGSMILDKDQGRIWKLGQIWALIGDEKKIAAKLGRQAFSLPFINTDVGRMIPRTHEAYMLWRRGTGRDFGVGHFHKTKAQGAEKFIYMSEAAGVTSKDRGVSAAAGKLDLGENTTVGAFNYYGWDLYNTLYVEADWNSLLFGDYGIKLGAQYAKQDSVGDDLAGDFDTDFFGVKASGSHFGVALSLTYTWTDSDGAVRSHWGAAPGYNFRLLESFDRAGEESLGIALSTSGEQIGAPWLSGSLDIVRGWDAEDETTGLSLEDVTEYDMALIFRPTEGYLKGLDIRLIYAVSDFEGGTDRWNTRFVVNYPFDLL